MNLISDSANDGSHTRANINAIPVHIWALWKWGITGKYETIKTAVKRILLFLCPLRFMISDFKGRKFCWPIAYNCVSHSAKAPHSHSYSLWLTDNAIFKIFVNRTFFLCNFTFEVHWLHPMCNPLMCNIVTNQWGPICNIFWPTCVLPRVPSVQTLGKNSTSNW